MRDEEWIYGSVRHIPGKHQRHDWVRLLRRQGNRCAGPMCGRSFDEWHPYKCLRVPPSKGGTTNVGNLVALCFDCMSVKHDMLWIEFRRRRQRNADILAAGPQGMGTGRPTRIYYRMKELARERGYI